MKPKLGRYCQLLSLSSFGLFLIFMTVLSCGGGGGGGGATPADKESFDPSTPGADMTIETALSIDVVDRRPVFLSNLGPPDTFSKSADEVEGKIIVTEEWSYIEMGVRLDIIDGEIAYVMPIDTAAQDAALYPRFYDPMEFDLPMDKAAVMQILAGQDLTQLDLSEAGIEAGVMVLGDQIMLGFVEDQLVYVETFTRIPDPEGDLDNLFVDEPVEGTEIIIETHVESDFETVSPASAASDTTANASPKASVIESFLPPQARLVIGFFRLFRAHDRRNRIYREASHVQRDYDAYIDRLKDKAKELASACNLSTLDRQSNIATLVKLIARLEMERQTVTALTESEKKQARSRFIHSARTEIIGALRTSGIGLKVLQKIQDAAQIDQTLTEIEDLVDGVLDPGDFQLKMTERLDKLGILGQVIGGTLGERFRDLIVRAQRSIPGVSNLQDAAAEMKTIVLETRTTIAEIEDALTEDTSILSPAQLIGVIDELADTLSDPAFDAVAMALAREMEPGFARNLAVAKGALDPKEFTTMYERVRGQVLQNRSEWLRQRARGECGRPAGAAFRTTFTDSASEASVPTAAATSSAPVGPGGTPLPVCDTMPIDMSGAIADVFTALNAGNYINPDDIAVCRTANDQDGDGSDALASGGDDCDDDDEDRYPGNVEACDDKDNNCDGQVDEGLSVDSDGDGHYTTVSCDSPADDCNDNDATIYPGAPEVENDGIDQDCDGSDAVPEIKRYYLFRRSGTGYRKKWGGYAEKRTGYDFFYLYVLPSEVDDAVSNYAKFDEATATACAGTSPPLCPCPTYPDIWASGSIEKVDDFETFEEMADYSCDTYQFDPTNIICTQWEVDTDPKYWNNINTICGY
jgi:hypothetical protein